MSFTDTYDVQNAQLATLKAAELELTEGPDVALQFLGPPTDPIRMRATLSILIRADRYEQACAIVQDIVPDKRWLDLGVLAFAHIGKVDRANELIAHAELTSELSLIRRTRVAFAEGALGQLKTKCTGGSLLAAHDWSPSDVALANSAIESLDPILFLVRANRGIQGDLQLSAVQSSVYLGHIAEHSILRESVTFLIRHVPISLIVAELCLRGIVSAPNNLPDRLRTEHPGQFQPALLAAIVERDLMNRPEESLDAMIELSSKTTTSDERETISQSLFETSGRCGPEYIRRASEAAIMLMPEDARLAGLFGTLQSLAENNPVEAKDRLNSIRDENDGVWWQAQAYICEKEGNEEEAQKAWVRAAELLPHPDIVRRSVQASIDRRRYESAIRGLKQLLAKGSQEENDIKVLAWTLMQIGNFQEASQYLQRLVEIDPNNSEYRVGLAQSLVHCARVSDAIEVLNVICESDEPTIEALLLQSELLEADNRAHDAFRVIESVASDHWDDPKFVLIYMHRAHAAGVDKLAHEAFARLLELRSSGKVPTELMQEGSLDQLLAYGKEYHNRRATLQESVVGGRLPWLFVEDVLGNPAMWAWTLHTQELRWLSEERLNRAAYSVYSTNGFTVCNRPASNRLESITCPPADIDVVVDLSALITLHQLELLPIVAEHFSQLILPASYGDLKIRDATRFGQNQPSREAELTTIREAIERGRISISKEAPDSAFVDEYSDESDTPAYRIRDLLAALKKSQRVSQASLDEIYTVAHKPETINCDNPALTIGQRTLVALSTLRTLSLKAAFGSILDSFDVILLASDQDELQGELQAHKSAKLTRSAHDDLWASVAELARHNKLQWMPVQGEDIHEDSIDPINEAELPSLHLDSLELARRIDKPLLTDDRVLQVQMFHHNASESWRAFGSDQCVLALAESASISNKESAKAIRRMMRWRYRFLVPSAVILKAYADDSRDNLPGDALLDVACYLHDCLRDPGLHCGPENSEPPMQMGVKFVTTWTEVIVMFLADVWKDKQYSDHAARQLTLWAGEELIPACPKGLWWQQAGLNLSRILGSSTLQLAFVHFASIPELNRANLALRTLAEVLGLDEQEFVKTAVEAIDAIR